MFTKKSLTKYWSVKVINNIYFEVAWSAGPETRIKPQFQILEVRVPFALSPKGDHFSFFILTGFGK